MRELVSLFLLPSFFFDLLSSFAVEGARSRLLSPVYVEILVLLTPKFAKNVPLGTLIDTIPQVIDIINLVTSSIGDQVLFSLNLVKMTQRHNFYRLLVKITI